MELKKIIMSKLLSGFHEVIEKKFILVSSVQKLSFVVIPPSFKPCGLSNIGSVGMSIEDFVDTGLVGMRLINELHVNSLMLVPPFCIIQPFNNPRLASNALL